MAVNRFVDASVYLVLRDAKPPQSRTHQLVAEPQTAIGVCEEAKLTNKNRSWVPRHRSGPQVNKHVSPNTNCSLIISELE